MLHHVCRGPVPVRAAALEHDRPLVRARSHGVDRSAAMSLSVGCLCLCAWKRIVLALWRAPPSLRCPRSSAAGRASRWHRSHAADAAAATPARAAQRTHVRRPRCRRLCVAACACSSRTFEPSRRRRLARSWNSPRLQVAASCFCIGQYRGRSHVLGGRWPNLFGQ